MKPYAKLIPHVAILVVVGIGLFLTRNWPYETALFPKFGCIAVLCVTVLAIITEIVRPKGRREEQQEDLGKAAVVFGWLVVFVIAVWAFGYEFAAVAFVFFFMKFHGKLSMKTAIVYSCLSGAFLFLLYRLLLDMTWPQGALSEVLGL